MKYSTSVRKRRRRAWDFAFLAVVGLSIFSWWKLWDAYSSPEEWYLWASLFGLIGVVWFLFALGRAREKKGMLLMRPRRPEPSASEIRKARIQLVLLKVAVPLVLAMIWGYEAFTIYRLPTFPENVAGIYIARFENDRGGVVQNRIVGLIKETISSLQIPTTIDVYHVGVIVSGDVISIIDCFR